MLKTSMSVLATMLLFTSSAGWVSAASEVTRTAQGPNLPGYRTPMYGNYQPTNPYGSQIQYDWGNANPYGNSSGYTPVRPGYEPARQQDNYGVGGGYGSGRVGSGYRSYDNAFTEDYGIDSTEELQVQVAPSRFPSYGSYQDQGSGFGFAGAGQDFGFPTQNRYRPSYGTGWYDYGTPQDDFAQPRGSWRTGDYNSYQAGYRPYAGQYAPGGFRGRHHCRQSGYGWGRPSGY